MSRRYVGAAAAVLGCVCLAVAARPPVAQACGGFFCQRMPMDQAGEQIVFSVASDGTMTAYVQIQYSGAADAFAWILPVPAPPTLSVGSDALFQQLNQTTAPEFYASSRVDGTCREEPPCAASRTTPSGEYDGVSGGAAADAGSPSGAVVVLSQAPVGPYDTAVLNSADPMALRTWLSDNGYDIPAAAGPLLDHYVTKDDYFVALKLRENRGVGDLAPIGLHFTEQYPCIPIKLTAIATVPDMPITAYILGSTRAMPLNYMSVEPDLDVPDLWMGGPRQYKDIVSNAIDDVGGHGFVTEYAGAVPPVSLTLEPIDDLRTTTDPSTFLSQLLSRGFTGDAQLLAILERFVPPPSDGTDPQQFYNCIVSGYCPTYDSYLATLAFDPSGFVDALNEAIVQPRADAQAMLDSQPKITRLFTTMSADEMTLDPVFGLSSPGALPDVSNVHMATFVTKCGPQYFYWSAPEVLELPSGRSVSVRDGIPYTGTDAEYCADYESGAFTPWTTPAVARATAVRRSTEPGGGGGCSAAGGAGGTGALFLVGLAVLFGVERRRRKR